MKLLCSIVRTSVACVRLWCLVPLVWMVVGVAVLPARAQTTIYTVPEAAEANKLYTSTNGAGWKNKQGWPLKMTYTTTSNARPTANGVGFSGSEPQLLIQRLILDDNQLSGSIPNFNLPNLQGLGLSFNQLSGSIPNFNLPNLQELRFFSNQLSGSIPNFNLPNLQDLDLRANQLSGSIPNFNLPNLQDLALSINQLSGSIPNFNLPNLQDLALSFNQLSGSIPNFNLPNLQSLWLISNQLSGSIPNFNLPNLQDLALSINQLSGSIPNFNLPNLQLLVLDSNQLSGCDVDWTKFPKITYLSLARNKLVFRDLEAAARVMQGKVGATFSYSPQDSVAMSISGDTVRMDVGGERTQYQWYRNGEAIANATQAFYKMTDTALYFCRATNTLLPDLVLTSYPIRGGTVVSLITALNIRPNPFWEHGSISYSLTRRLPVSIAVYSLLGQKLLTVFEGEQRAGTHVQELTMSGFSIGVYLVRVQAGDGVQSAFVHYVR
ncbi:MAG: leucine-rich repeat domain-containing protein [Candidatus Kapabacteria bacterium]|nr:leucine-rich repeat domain-containing protein [Candidatus Kapabacteria bacterium]